MAGEEKAPGLVGSSPPRAPLTDFEVAIQLERIKLEMRSNRDEQRREFELIRVDLKTAKDNDERFARVEHDVRVAKWAVMIFGGALITAMAIGLAGRFSVRIADPPPPPSNAERMGSDRVPPPTPSPLPKL